MSCVLSGRSADARSERRAFMKDRSLLSLSLAIAVCAFFAGPLQAQQKNPGFSNVNDILQGDRTLLQITDLQVAGLGKDNFAYLYHATTSNSSVAKTSLTPTYLPVTDGPNALRAFSGWMFNQPEAITVAAINGILVIQNIPNTGPRRTVPPVSPPIDEDASVTAGKMAD